MFTSYGFEPCDQRVELRIVLCPVGKLILSAGDAPLPLESTCSDATNGHHSLRSASICVACHYSVVCIRPAVSVTRRCVGGFSPSTTISVVQLRRLVYVLVASNCPTNGHKLDDSKQQKIILPKVCMLQSEVKVSAGLRFLGSLWKDLSCLF